MVLTKGANTILTLKGGTSQINVSNVSCSSINTTQNTQLWITGASQSLINHNGTDYNGIISSKTKNGRVSICTWPK